MKTVTMWKALRSELKSQYDGSQWKIGKWRKGPKVTGLCVGFNASPRVIDAMRYINMEILARVECRGSMIKGDDKITCSQMKIIEGWVWPKEESVRLAVFAAELCLPFFEVAYPTDDRPRNAIKAAKAWVDTPAESARSAASAAENAARSASWSAAWSAESAARSAAWSAASAAENAARSASWSAAWSAESAAAVLDQIEAYIQSRIPLLKKYG